MNKGGFTAALGQFSQQRTGGQHGITGQEHSQRALHTIAILFLIRLIQSRHASVPLGHRWLENKVVGVEDDQLAATMHGVDEPLDVGGHDHALQDEQIVLVGTGGGQRLVFPIDPGGVDTQARQLLLQMQTAIKFDRGVQTAGQDEGIRELMLRHAR